MSNNTERATNNMTDDTNDMTDEQTELTNADVDQEDGPVESRNDGPVDQEDPLDIEYEPGRKEPLDHGVKIRGKVKRGTAPRNHDELLLEGRGEDAEEAAEDFEDALNKAEEKGWSERLRQLNQDENEGDDE